MNTAFLLGGRRSLLRRRAAWLTGRQRRSADRPGARSALIADSFVAGPAMGRYHRPACILVSGKGTESLPRAAHEAARRVRCGVCRP